MVTLDDIEAHRRAARMAFELHADAMGKVIRSNRALTTEMCRWLSMNISVLDDVATALAAGDPGPDEAFQHRVAAELGALRLRAPEMATTAEMAVIEGLRAAILLRLSRPEGATENGRRALEALLETVSRSLVPKIVDLGMAARLKRGRVRRIAAAFCTQLAVFLKLRAYSFTSFGAGRADGPATGDVRTPDSSRATQDERADLDA